MRRTSCKTFDRARGFVLDGLNWRGAARPYALVVWGLLAGLVWTGLDLALAGQVTGGLLLLKLVLLALLTAIAAIDARFGIIPDSLSGMLLLTGALNVLLESSHAAGTLTSSSTELAALRPALEAIGWRFADALIAVLAAIGLESLLSPRSLPRRVWLGRCQVCRGCSAVGRASDVAADADRCGPVSVRNDPVAAQTRWQTWRRRCDPVWTASGARSLARLSARSRAQHLSGALAVICGRLRPEAYRRWTHFE